jgi:hypothetical protein
LQVVLRHPRRPAFGPSRFDVGDSALAARRRSVPFASANLFVPAVLSPCVYRAPGPRRASRFYFTVHTGPVRVIAPRSLFRAAFRYPLDQTLPRLGQIDLIDPATLMGLVVPFAVFPGGAGHAHFCASSPHAVSRFARLPSVPADFYGRRSRISKLLPTGGGRYSKNATGLCNCARRRPASGSCCRGQAERALMRDTIRRLSQWMPRCVCRARVCARQSCHGLLLASFGRVGCRFSGTCVCPCSSSNTGTPPIAAAVPFAGLPSARGFCGELLQDVRSGSRLLSIELQRRHPCRRRPFSVFGRFAPSHSERSRSSHCR